MKQKLFLAKMALAATILSGGAAWGAPKTVLCMAEKHAGNYPTTALKILQNEDGTLSARIDTVNVFHGRILADRLSPILAVAEVRRQYFCGGLHHYRGAGFRLEFYDFSLDEPEQSGSLKLQNADGTSTQLAMEKILDTFEVENYCEPE